MKRNCLLILALAFSTSLFAQDATNAPAATPPAKPAPPPMPIPTEPLSRATLDKIAAMTPIFDGKTLDGWIDQENSAGALEITNFNGLAQKILGKTDLVSAFLNSKMEATNLTNLAAYSETNPDARKIRSACVRDLNKIISDGSIYDPKVFGDVTLSAGTKQLLNAKPTGQELVRLNKLLLEDAYPTEIAKSPASGWAVKDGVIASTGAGRGTLYTKAEYSNYRIIFSMRHVSGKPDHQACVLVYCYKPTEKQKTLDALGGVQFQVPNGGSWDYRPGKNNGGKGVFTKPPHPRFDVHEWSQVEILVNTNGTARMAVAQPPGNKAVETLDFSDPTAGRVGPFALQMHNGGLFDEYKDIRVEENPAEDKLITTE